MAAIQELDMEVSIKVIIVGNGMVGKTSLMGRFCKGEMTDKYKKTIGTDYAEKDIVLKETGDTVRLMLWDTAGQEMFGDITRNYYRGAGAVVYVFSAIDRDSFLDVERWKRKVEEECGDIISVLVQNKSDLPDKFAVQSSEVEDLARRMGVKLYRTSVKTNLLVDDVFDYVADAFIKSGGETQQDIEPVPGIGSVGGSDKKSNTNTGTKANQKHFKLEPLTRRTKGKKDMCVVM